MSEIRIELHGRRREDLATLSPVREALEARGERVRLTVAPGTWLEPGDALPAGPNPCDVAVVVARPGGVRPVGARLCVAILDSLGLPGEVAPEGDLAGADLVLVPGPSHERALAGKVRGRVHSAGVARLDAAIRDPDAARDQARRELAVPPRADVVLYEPARDLAGGSPDPMAEEIARLAASGPLVILLPGDAPSAWCDEQRSLAARTPGLALMEGVDPSSALLAADVICAARDSLLLEALALGKAAVCTRPSEGSQVHLGLAVYEPGALVSIVRGALSSGTQDDNQGRRVGWLAQRGTAASAMAECICELLEQAAPPAPQPFAAIEARLAFGDTEGAREQLETLLSQQPSAEAYRLLAAVERRRQRPAAVRVALDAAERLARTDLSRVLCERARLLLDGEKREEAAARYREAGQVDSESVDALVGLGSLAMGSGRVEEGEVHFRRALELETSARTLCGFGLAQSARGMPRAAIASFERALDLEPDCLSAVCGMVEAAYRSGDLGPAERRVSAYLELHSGDLDMSFTLAGLRCQLGDRSGAQQMIERIELFDPEYEGLAELRHKVSGL